MNIDFYFPAIKTKQHSIFFFFPILLSLTACSANLEKIDLESLLIHPGDLPAEYTVKTAQALSRKGLERMAGLPLPLKGSRQTFERENGTEGYVRVFLLRTTEDLNQVYAVMEDDIQQNDTELSDRIKKAWNLKHQLETTVGEAASIEMATYPFADSIGNNKVKEYGMAQLLFRRCRAIVKIRLKRTYERAEREADASTEPASKVSAELAYTDLLAYAKRLDTRLQKETCP